MGNNAPCSKNTVKPGIQDPAYAHGNLALSELGENVEKSSCGQCYIGVISAGGPSGAEKSELFNHLTTNGKMPAGTTSLQAWSRCEGATPKAASGPFFTSCPDGQKQKTVPFIKQWYQSKNIEVDDDEVYFFDDRVSNVHPFNSEKPYNAKQVSCATRDTKIQGGAVGLCGATMSEITLAKGMKTCAGQTMMEEIV